MHHEPRERQRGKIIVLIPGEISNVLKSRGAHSGYIGGWRRGCDHVLRHLKIIPRVLNVSGPSSLHVVAITRLRSRPGYAKRRRSLPGESRTVRLERFYLTRWRCGWRETFPEHSFSDRPFSDYFCARACLRASANLLHLVQIYVSIMRARVLHFLYNLVSISRSRENALR